MIAIVTGVFAVLTAIVLYAIANLMDRFEEKNRQYADAKAAEDQK